MNENSKSKPNIINKINAIQPKQSAIIDYKIEETTLNPSKNTSDIDKKDSINNILTNFKKKSRASITNKSSFHSKSNEMMSLTGSKFNCSKNYDDINID